jgi:hypothetical protein
MRATTTNVTMSYYLGVCSTREKVEARQRDAVHDRDFAFIPTASS